MCLFDFCSESLICMERSTLFGLSQVMLVGILLLIELEFALTLRLLLRNGNVWLCKFHSERVYLLVY